MLQKIQILAISGGTQNYEFSNKIFEKSFISHDAITLKVLRKSSLGHRYFIFLYIVYRTEKEKKIKILDNER
jgi:hypothetical protein